MKDFEKLFGTRLKAARLLNGLSLQDLANALAGKLTKQSLHRYEKGEVIPDSEITGWLSDALNVRPDFFTRETKVEFKPISYRKLKSTPAKEVNKISELTREYLERYLELEAIVGLTGEFDNHLKDFPPVKSFDDTDRAAGQLRTKWNLGNDPIHNVVELLEDKQIKVVALQVNGKFDGLQTIVNGNIPVIAYNAIKISKPDRIRFTLLHELGHLLLKFKKDLSEKEVETLCNQFAAAMLLPKASIQAILGEYRTRLSVTELGLIKKQYGISMQAIVMRARDCGIINDHYARQFFMMIAGQGWKKDEPFDYTGEEKSARFDQLLLRALAEEQISMSKAAALKNQRLADFKKDTLVF